jgi:hypothetical protein
MAGNPPAEASQPPGMNGMIVTVPTKVMHEPRAPSMPNFLFQKPSNSSVPNVHSQQPKNQVGAAEAKGRIQPENQWAMADIGDQSLRLIRPPFLIAEEEKYDDHGPAKDMVIEILFEEAASDQDICQRI